MGLGWISFYLKTWPFERNVLQRGMCGVGKEMEIVQCLRVGEPKEKWGNKREKKEVIYLLVDLTCFRGTWLT